jgi:hypothetical protein
MITTNIGEHFFLAEAGDCQISLYSGDVKLEPAPCKPQLSCWAVLHCAILLWKLQEVFSSANYSADPG